MEQPNYAKQLLLQMNQQRSKGYLCDVIIVVENALFRAHKNILAASSSYFKSLVLHDNLINLDVEMVKPSVFRQVLDFIYTGRLATSDPSSDHSVSALLTAASYLQLSDLAALCRRRLKNNGTRTSSGSGKLPSTTSTSSPTPNGCFPHPQRLSSTPLRLTHNHHSGSTGRSHSLRREGRLGEDLSEEEGFTAGSHCVPLSPSAAERVSNGMEAGPGLGLGLDLSKKSPSGSTATEQEVSPGSSLPGQSSPHGSASTTNSASFEDTPPNATNPNAPAAYSNPGREPSDSGEDPKNATTDFQHRPAAAKRPRPRSEGSRLEEPGRVGLPNGPEKRRGAPGVTGGVDRDDSVSPELRNGNGGGGGEENGLEQSEESGQSESGDTGGRRRTRKRNANYIYRQPPPPQRDASGFEPALGDNLYVCIPCGKGFPSSEQLNAHVDTHTEEELYIKEEEEDEEEEDLGGASPKEEDDPEDLRSMQMIEAGANDGDSPPRHACTVCTKSYKDAGSLRQHEKSHWLSRPFPCNICGKLFTQRGTMTRHMRSHLGLKPFACEECGMRFTRQYRLTEHMRVHSGEKPYECQLCGGKFTQQRNLISHLKMHTSPT